jgi:CheY-like chemotaxis protein
MPQGGAITVKAVVGAPAARNGKRRYVGVQVSDTGCGMDPQTLKKAIEPFFSTKPRGKGTGLGLSMVHGLAVQLGGSLELNSEPDKGTQAMLWLPVAAIPAVREAMPATAVSAVRPATILLVDDDPLIAMSTVDMLEDLGHKVFEAHSGPRALEIIEGGQSIDLVMTDQVMPGMSGLELAAIVRRKLPDVPVLLATGYADLESGQMTDLPRLSKPYRQAQLQHAIDRLLGA